MREGVVEEGGEFIAQGDQDRNCNYFVFRERRVIGL